MHLAQARSEGGAPPAPPPGGERELPPQHLAREATDAASLDYERDRQTEASRVRACFCAYRVHSVRKSEA